MELDSPAQILQRRHIDRAAALRHAHDHDIVLNCGLVHAQSVILKKSLVTHRDSIKRSCNLALVEAANIKRIGGGIEAESVVRGKRHPRGRGREDLQRTGSRHELVHDAPRDHRLRAMRPETGRTDLDRLVLGRDALRRGRGDGAPDRMGTRLAMGPLLIRFRDIMIGGKGRQADGCRKQKRKAERRWPTEPPVSGKAATRAHDNSVFVHSHWSAGRHTRGKKKRLLHHCFPEYVIRFKRDACTIAHAVSP